MSTEVAIQNNLGMSMAEAMGVASGAGEAKRAALTRISLVQTPIMGTMDVNGKKVKTEVVPVGAYKITQTDGNVAYSLSPSIRIFAVRWQWSKWDAEEEVMHKSVMSIDLKGDLKDTKGTFNLGRPSGYVEDWEKMPQKTKDLIRSIKRKRIVFGLLTVNDATDDQGNPVEVNLDAVPFVYEVSPSSVKPFEAALKQLERKNAMYIQYAFTLSATEGKLPNGNTFAIMGLTQGASCDITQADYDTMKDFLDFIEYQNSYILQQWSESNVESLSEADADVVSSFVNVEEAD
jgi:hypothetical protein